MAESTRPGNLSFSELAPVSCGAAGSFDRESRQEATPIQRQTRAYLFLDIGGGNCCDSLQQRLCIKQTTTRHIRQLPWRDMAGGSFTTTRNLSFHTCDQKLVAMSTLRHVGTAHRIFSCARFRYYSAHGTRAKLARTFLLRRHGPSRRLRHVVQNNSFGNTGNIAAFLFALVPRWSAPGSATVVAKIFGGRQDTQHQ